MKGFIAVLVSVLLLMTAYGDAVSDLRPVIKEVAAQNGLDPVLMEAIIRQESAHATSHAARTKNNLAGIMGRKGQRSYASKEECIKHLGSILVSYRAKGRVTVAQIARAYCKSRATWTTRVNGFIAQIRAGRWGEIEK